VLVRSEIGRGSRFTIELPLNHEEKILPGAEDEPK
jgi:signal transduction histidine kinase